MRHLDVAGCFLLCDNTFLVLHRHPDISEGGKWALPAGKIHKEKETIEGALVREIQEETGLVIDKTKLTLLDERIWEFPGELTRFYAYMIVLDGIPSVTIRSDEHADFQWITLEQGLTLPNRIYGLDELIVKLQQVYADK